MTPEVRFDVSARHEFLEAAGYYESESPGLGADFIQEIERSIQLIVEHPEADPIIAGTVRRRLVRRFPYALLYSVRPMVIRILAVMHLKRRPMYWVDRE